MAEKQGGGDLENLKQELVDLARHHTLIGWDKIEYTQHALLVITAVQAFGDDPRATFFMEVRAGRSNIPRPDLILLHPEIGVLVIENKGIKLEEILNVQGTTLSLLRDGLFKREDPFEQAEKVALRLRDLAAKRVNLSEALFLHTAALPRIDRSVFEQKFEVEWPEETLFADAFASPAAFHAQILAYSNAKQATTQKSHRLSKRANDAVRMVLDGKGFLHSPRTIYVEKATPDLLGARIQEMELGLKEATLQQREHGIADMRGQHRLFRGVAGSGKSILLALSAAQTLGWYSGETASLFDAGGQVRKKRVLVACFNRTLVHYLRQRIDDRYGRLTWEKPSEESLTVVHFDGLLRRLERQEVRLATGLTYKEKEARAKLLCQKFDALDEKSRDSLQYDAIYLDEAQDFLPDEISLLLRLARKDEKGQQTFIVFYDNAQNIYGVTPPVWEKLGVNILGGRTVFLDQCLRNTTEALSLAFNVLVGSFAPESERVTTRTFADVRSLRDRKLIKEDQGRFEVLFAPRRGPLPVVRCYPSRNTEVAGVAEEVRSLVHEQRVVPSDILVLYKSHYSYQADLMAALERAVGKEYGVRQVRSDDADSKSRPLIEDGTLTVSTIASAKGYDAPIVIVLGVDELATDTKGRASFYVGATRGKLALTVSGIRRDKPTLLDEVVAAAYALGPAGNVTGYWGEAAKKVQPPPIPKAVPPIASKPTLVKPKFKCRHCGRAKLHAQHRRFGYYFVCIDCGQNTPIASICPGCGKKEKIRKDQLRFTAECPDCLSKRLIHTNASANLTSSG